MNSRYLSFLIILIFRGIISCSLADSSSTVRQRMISNVLSHPINLNNLTSEWTWSIFSPLKFIINLEALELQDTVSKVKEPVMQAFTPDMVIQVGAFLRESNAVLLKERLSALLNKKVIIETVDNYFKVRITGFTSPEEMENLIPTLGLLGIKNIWIFRFRKKEDIKPPVAMQADTSLKTVKDKITMPVIAQEKPVVAELTINLQVGIFHKRSEALRAQRIIKSKLNLPVEIVREWEYYIVFITGFKTREEMFKYYPKLAALGYPDSFMIDSIKGAVHNK